MGCGAAFFDYDNDGWLDIFLVNASEPRPERPGPQAHELPVPQQPRRHLHRRHPEGRPHALRLGPGLLRGRLRQRRLRRPLRQLLGQERALPQQRRRHVHGRLRAGGSRGTPGPLGGRVLLSRLRPGRPSGPVRGELRELRSGPGATARRLGLLPLQRDPGALRSAGLRRRHEHPVPQPRGRHLRRRLGGVGHRPSPRARLDGVRGRQLAAHRLLRDGSGGGRFRQRRLARHLRRLRHRREPALPQQPRRHLPRDRGPGRLRLRRERGRPGRNGRGRGRLRRRRLAGHRPHELLRAGADALPKLSAAPSRTPACGAGWGSTGSTSASASTSSISTTTAGGTS